MSFWSLPALVQPRAVLFLTLLSLLGCEPPYGGVHCEALTVDTPLSTLPLGPGVTIAPLEYRYSETFIAGSMSCWKPWMTWPARHLFRIHLAPD